MAGPAAAPGILAVAVAAKSPGEVFLPQEDRLGRGWRLLHTQGDAGSQLQGEHRHPLASVLPLCVPLGGWSQPGSGQMLDVSARHGFTLGNLRSEGSGSEAETWVLGEGIAGYRTAGGSERFVPCQKFTSKLL